MRRLCEEICRRHAVFRHIDISRIAITWAQTRSPVEWGLQAKLTPMRFEGGSLVCVRDGQRWGVQRLYQDGEEMLYILTFYLPRFLNLSFEEKLVTVFHELYHVSPEFDGDIRRFAGACYMHSASQAEYDRLMAAYAREYLADLPRERFPAFLQYDFEGLRKQFGAVVGLQLSAPKLIPLNADAEMDAA